MKNIIARSILIISLTLGYLSLPAQSNLSKARVYAKSALKEYADDFQSWPLKKIHHVIIEDWNYNSHTGRYIIIFKGKWEDSGFFFDDIYEDTFTLKCDYDSCNATIKREQRSYKHDLECLEN